MRSTIFISTLGLLLISACSMQQQSEGDTLPVTEELTAHTTQIVTTFAPIYSFTSNVVQGRAKVHNLVPVGTSVHTYALKPSDMELLSNADILVMNGLGVEGFLQDAIEASGNSKLVIIDLSQSIYPDNEELVPEGEEDIDQYDDEVGNHNEGGTDPHIWLSLDNAVIMVDYLASRLGEKYPENADFYRINANTYNSTLMKLKDEISDDFSGIQPARFFVFHNAYDYYLEENNLENYKAGVVEEFPGDEPGASYLQELTDMIGENNVKLVFTEPQFSPKLIRTLEEELDIYTFEIDPIGNEVSATGYQNNMRKITKNFVQGFAVVD